jgi:hypothetical protein
MPFKHSSLETGNLLGNSVSKQAVLYTKINSAPQ